MKSTGIVRRIDNLGRVVIPMELRRTLDVRNGDPLEIFVDGNTVLLEKYVAENRCAVCRRDDNLIKLDSGWICRSCVDTASKSLRSSRV